jgi:predicted O-methyltransferase YrrM
VTAGGSSIPEVQDLLSVLAAGRRRAAEIGTAVGEGAAAIATSLPPGGTLVTVECDPERADAARAGLAGLDNVRLLVGDWREELPPFGPFDFMFVDVHEAKTDPLVVDLLEPPAVNAGTDPRVCPCSSNRRVARPRRGDR